MATLVASRVFSIAPWLKTGEIDPVDDAETDLHRVRARAADGLADQVHEGHGARLEADGVDVRQVVADHAQVLPVRVEAGEPGRK